MPDEHPISKHGDWVICEHFETCEVVNCTDREIHHKDGACDGDCETIPGARCVHFDVVLRR